MKDTFAAPILSSISARAQAMPAATLSARKPEQIAASAESLTGRYLSGVRADFRPETRRSPTESHPILGAHANNLKDVTFASLGLFTVVTGVPVR